MAHISQQIRQQQAKTENLLTSKPDANTGLTNTAKKSPPPSECPNCGGVGYVGYDVPVGHPRFGKVDRCSNPIHHDARLEDKLSSLSDLRPDDLNTRLADIANVAGNEEMLVACRRMLEKPRGWLYIWGGPGNAKTIALRAMCNELAARGFYPIVYIKFSRLVEIVRQARAAEFAKGEYLKKHGDLEDWDNSYESAKNRLLKIKVLAIEEFDKGKVTEFVEAFRFDFLDERYEQGVRGETITMFASQYHPSEFTEVPLVSRFMSGKFIIAENRAGDARGSEKWPDEIEITGPDQRDVEG